MAALVLATTVASTAGQWVLAPPSAFADPGHCNEETGEGCDQPAPVPDPTPEPEPVRDTTPPDTTITDGPAEGSTITTNAATFSFKGTVEDTAKLQCALDRGEFADCLSPHTFEGLSEGAHTVRFRAVDAAGNADTSPVERSFTVDTVAPNTVIADGPAEGSRLTSNAATFSFGGTVGDTAKLQCALDRGEFADCTSPHTFSNLSEGSHTVAFRAVDAAGNVDTSPAERSFTVDTTAPNTVITDGPAEGSRLTSSSARFFFEGTAGDTARLQCSLDRGEFADCTSPHTFEGLSEGAHTVRFRAVDAAGNVDASPAERSFTVDTFAPNTVITDGPAEGARLTSSSARFFFEGTAGDTTRLQCALDRGEFADCTSPHTFTGLSDGAHTAWFRAVDAAGNADSTPARRTFTVDTVVIPPSPTPDTTAPDTVITAGPEEGSTLTTGAATFSFEGTAGDTARLQCSLDGSEFADCTSPRTFTGLIDGDHTVAFRAVDAAGNSDASPATRSFTVDTTPVAPPAPDNTFRVAKRGVPDTDKGTRTARVVVPGPGTVQVLPQGAAPVRATTSRVARGGATSVTIEPTRAGKRMLVRKLRQARVDGESVAQIDVRVEIVFTPDGGTPSTIERVFTLKLR